MDLHVEIKAETLFNIGPIPVTNSMLVMFIVMALILIVFSALARKAQTVPGRSQGVLEMVVEFLLNLVESTAGKRLGRRIFPLIAGLFIFIILANFSGLLPGVGSIYVNKDVPVEEAEEGVTLGADEQVADAAVNGEGEVTENINVPLFRPPTADLNMTIAMSLVTFTAVQIAGVSAHGARGRLKHMADPPFLFPIEVVSELSRIISLSARLFGNVFAGEVLLGVMYGIANAVKIAIIPLAFPVVFIGLEVLFGTIQALVFALLTLIYIYLAAAGHDDHEDEHVEEHDTVRAVADPAPEAGPVPVASGD